MLKKIVDRWFVRWLVILLVIFSATLLLRNSFGYLDPDFGWHYKVGQEIWQNRQLPRIEHHLFPIAGQSWVDHEWLANLFIFALSSWGGYLLVSFFFAVLVILAWWLMAKSTIRQWLDGRANSFIFWLLLILGLKACFPHFGVRVQEITVLFLLILNLWLAAIVRRRRWHLWEIVAMPVFLWLWACLHGGFLIGLAVLATWIIFRLVIYLLNRYHRQLISPVNILPVKTIIQAVIVGFLALLATCLTPYGIKLYGFLADYQSNRAYLLFINEWQPITEAIWSWRMLYLVIFGLAIALLIFHWRSRQSADKRIMDWLWRQDWWSLFLSVILFVAAWRSLRHFPLFVVISLPWLAGFYYRSWQDHHFRPDQWSPYLKIFIIVVLLVSSVAVVNSTRWTNHPATNYCSKYPCDALNYLRQSPYSNWPTLVDYGWGGYFYWQWPEKQIFIDGRLPQYSWGDRTLIEHYNRFFAEEEIKPALDDYDISVIIMAQPQVVSFNWLEIWLLGRGRRVEDYDNSHEIMRRAMLKLPNWRLAYFDTVSMVYVRQ
jgi:hypothetical protein